MAIKLQLNQSRYLRVKNALLVCEKRKNVPYFKAIKLKCDCYVVFMTESDGC